MMAMTTSNSISVNPRRRMGNLTSSVNKGLPETGRPDEGVRT